MRLNESTAHYVLWSLFHLMEWFVLVWNRKKYVLCGIVRFWFLSLSLSLLNMGEPIATSFAKSYKRIHSNIFLVLYPYRIDSVRLISSTFNLFWTFQFPFGGFGQFHQLLWHIIVHTMQYLKHSIGMHIVCMYNFYLCEMEIFENRPV